MLKFITSYSFLAACLLSLVSAAAVPKTAHGALVADFASDFSAVTNPNGNWIYGAVTALGDVPTVSTLVTNYGAGNEVKAWSPAGTFWPTVGLNTAAVPVSFGAGNAITLAAGQGILHPGASGGFADVRLTIASSFSGTLSVVFQGVDAVNTTTDVHVLLNGAGLFSAAISTFGQTQTFNVTQAFVAGDVIDFAVGWGANQNYFDDSTGFTATLTTTELPEPSSLALLSAAIIGACTVRRRSKTNVWNAALAHWTIRPTGRYRDCR